MNIFHMLGEGLLHKGLDGKNPIVGGALIGVGATLVGAAAMGFRGYGPYCGGCRRGWCSSKGSC